MSSFSDRRQALFDCLNVAESQISNTRALFKIPEPRSTRSNFKKMRHETKQFKGRKCLFTRPDVPITQCLTTRANNFQRNLDKWTYYNLEDVPEVTERTNADALAACREEIEMSKNSCDDMDIQESDIPVKVAFKLPIRETPEDKYKQIDDQSVTKEKIFINSKIILPEYVVGQKKTIKPKHFSKSGDLKKSELKLDHLYDEDDVDD